MRLEMSFGFGQRQEARQRQTLEQREAVKLNLLQINEDLVAAMRDFNFKPKAVCSKCGYSLNSLEVLKGFSSDVFDYNTTCPKCMTRFMAKLYSGNNWGGTEMIFYCPSQALEILAQSQHLKPKQFRKEAKALYYSTIYHFGNMRSAFAKIGLEYPFEEINQWEQKVQPFLGRLPDTQIARAASVSAYQVRKLRTDLGVPKYRKSMDEDYY